MFIANMLNLTDQNVILLCYFHTLLVILQYEGFCLFHKVVNSLIVLP